jgi:uncharacterized protein (DUF433 family)
VRLRYEVALFDAPGDMAWSQARRSEIRDSIQVWFIAYLLVYDQSVMDWKAYITVDPAVCHGKACIKGTRIPAAVVRANLAAGVAREDLLRSYPSLTPEAI